ncbi:MAG: winged helix-turn-helix domain-containing protein [Chloroflexota bacterium]|nr:winged helix-turn-helix domain-containing protein [Chloroflexota bacterium]
MPEPRVTYRQEQRRCGKVACVCCAEGAAHGPYWYAYWRDHAGSPKRAYCGKGPDRVALLADEERLHWVAPLKAQLFGGLVLKIGGHRVREHDWPRQSSRRLLALLLLHPQGLSRDALMDTLWPDRPAGAAANALKSALSGLRRVLEAAPSNGREMSPSNGRLQHRASIVHLELTVFDDVDVHEYVECGPVLHTTTGELERLVNLYTGELLPEYVYEDWSSRHREHAQSVWRQAALELGHRYADREDDQRAISHLKRLVADAPTNEPGVRLLMMLYARNQERGRAADAYRHLAGSLEITLVAEPEPASQALYARLQGSEADEIASVIHFPSEDRRAAVDAWEKRALLLARRGATQEALSSLESGRSAAGDGMSGSTRGRLLLVESTIHNYIGDSRNAYDTAAAAETLCDALGDPLLTAEARRLRAKAALELNKPDEAFSLSRSSVALFATAGDDDGAMRSRRMVAFLLQRGGVSVRPGACTSRISKSLMAWRTWNTQRTRSADSALPSERSASWTPLSGISLRGYGTPMYSTTASSPCPSTII